MNHDNYEQLKALYDARTLKGQNDRVWASRPPALVPASTLVEGDAIYMGSDGYEFLVLKVQPIGGKLEIIAESDFTFCQPKPFRLAPETLVMASPLERGHTMTTTERIEELKAEWLTQAHLYDAANTANDEKAFNRALDRMREIKEELGE